MPQRTRSLQRFLDRARVTENHMRVVNKALSTVRERRAGGFSNSDRQIVNHAIARNAEIALQLMYGHFISYLKSVLREMYQKRPFEVIGKAPGSLNYIDIVKLGDWDALTQHMVDEIFKKLESTKNTRGLLRKILARTDVTVNEDVLEQALMYFEVRNLLVHNAGHVDKAFADRYGSLLNVGEGHTLKGNIGSTKKAIKSIRELCVEIDRGLIERGYADPII